MKKRLILASGLLTDFRRMRDKAPAICPETAAGGPVLIPVAKFNEGRDKLFVLLLAPSIARGPIRL